MEAPPTPVSPTTMAPSEKKEKKRKREKDPEKSAKKQRGESEAAQDPRVEDAREDGRSEKRKKRKEKKTKVGDEATVNGIPDAATQVANESLQSSSHAKNAPSADANDRQLVQHSPFIQRTTSLYLPLSPCASNFPLEGLLAEHVSPLLLTYFPPLKGVLLSYTNARLSEGPRSSVEDYEKRVLSQCINEYAVTFTWLTADFLLLRPRRGTWMEGYVRLGNESMIGLVCYNYFNAVIEREKMPSDWTWVAEEGEVLEEKGRRRNAVESAGFFRDGKGSRVEGRLVFRVEDFDALQGDGGGSVSIIGTLLSESDAR